LAAALWTRFQTRFHTVCKEALVSTLSKGSLIRRNDRCPCGSQRKFKSCCSPDSPLRFAGARIRADAREYASRVSETPREAYIDSGEEAVKWVIVDSSGTRLFVDKDSRVLVFADKVVAHAAATLEEFAEQTPGEINVAGVGPTKWQLLQEKLPFVEIADAESAGALIRERIEVRRAQLENSADES
jgi:hypothetical protein